MVWAFRKDAARAKARAYFSAGGEISLTGPGHDADGEAYHPCKAYDPALEQALIDQQSLEVNNRISEFTEPFKNRIIWCAWVGAGGMMSACLANLIVIFYGILSIEVPPVWKAVLVYAGPVLASVLIGIQWLRMYRQFTLLGLRFEIFFDDTVANNLKNQGIDAKGKLGVNESHSEVALYELMRLRMLGFHIWRRFSVHWFFLDYFLNVNLRIPFLTPRFCAVMAPIILVLMIVFYRLGGAAVSLQDSGLSGGDLALDLGLTLLGLNEAGARIQPVFGLMDGALIFGGIVAGLLPVFLARAYRTQVMERLEPILKPAPIMEAYTHDYGQEIIDRYAAVRDKLVRALEWRMQREGRRDDD